MDDITELLSLLAGLALTVGLALIAMGAAAGSTVALVAGLALLVPLTPPGLVVAWRAARRRQQALPRRFYDKPTVADPCDLRGGCGDWGGMIGW